MGIKAVAKAFAICLPEKMSIPLIKGEISRLPRLSSGYLYRRRANEDHINWLES